MNKQELIDKLKELITESTNEYDCGHDYGIRRAIVFAEQLDEPVKPPEPKPLEIEKPVVPQFVADWYEENKCYFEWNLYNFCVDFHEGKVQEDLREWFADNTNRPIETLVMMHKFGYEIEKEKRYTAKLKLTDEYLCYESQFKDLLHYKVPDSSAKEVKAYHFTEDDLVKYHIWGNDNYEVKEVQE